MTAVSPFWAGVTCRCPRCGKGRLLIHGLAVRENCERCGLDYKFIDTGDGPAVFAIFILGFLILGGALWVEFTFGPPMWVHLVLWGLATPLAAIGLLRLIKGTLIALQFHHKAEEGRIERD